MKKYDKIWNKYKNELTDEEYFEFFREIERQKYGENEFRLYYKD